MNMRVQKQRPGQKEGAQGELRLVLTGRNSYLYIKGGNQWHSLRLSPTSTSSSKARQDRGTFQRNVVTIAAAAAEHDGSILTGGGGAAGDGGGQPPDEPS